MLKLILLSTLLICASSIADNDNAQEVAKPKAKQNFAAVCKANINIADHLSELQGKLLQFGQFPVKQRKTKVSKQEKKEQLFNFLTSMSNEERQVLVKQICISKKWLPENQPKRADETDFEYEAQNTFKYSEYCVRRLVDTEFSQLEMSKQFKDMVLALLDKPAAYDARQLHRALTAPAINAETIMEITLFRNNYQLALIGRVYDIMLEMGIFGRVPTNFMGRLFASSKKRKNLGALKWMLVNVKDKRVQFTNEKGILVLKVCGNYCAKVFGWLSERLKLIGLQERLGLEEERTRKNVDGIITDAEKSYEIFIEKVGFVFSHFPADDIITLVTQSKDFGELKRNHALIPTELNPYRKEARIDRLYGHIKNHEQLRQEHSDYQMQLELLRRLWQMLGVYDFVQRDRGHLNERRNEDVARRIRASIDQKEYEELTRLLVFHSEVDLLNVAYHFQSLRQFDFEQKVKKMKPFLTGTPVSYTKAVEKLLYNPAELRRKLDMNILLEVKQNQQKGIATVSLKNGGSLVNFDKLRPEDFKVWTEQDLCINDPNSFSNLPVPSIKAYQQYPNDNGQLKQEILNYNVQSKQYTENANNANACPWCEQPTPAAKKSGRTRIFPFFSKIGSDKANKPKAGTYGFDAESEYETGKFVNKEMKQQSQKEAPISGVQMNATGFCTGYQCVQGTQYKDDSTGNTKFKPDVVAKKQKEFEMKSFVKTGNVQTVKVVVDDPKPQNGFVSRSNSENQAFPINPPFSSQPVNNGISPTSNQPKTANPIQNAQYNVPKAVNIEQKLQQQLTGQNQNYGPNFAVSQNPDELSAFDLIMRYIFQYNKYSTLEMAEIQYSPVAVASECKEFVEKFFKVSTSEDELMKHAMKENCRPAVFHAYRAIYLDVCRSCETGTQKWMDLLEQWQLTTYHRNFTQDPAKFIIEECPRMLKAYRKMENVQKLSQYDQVLRYIQHYGTTFLTNSDALEVAEKQCAIPNTVIPECRPFIESFVDGNVSDTQLTIDPKKDECRYAVYYVYRDVYLGVCQDSDTDYEIWKESLKQWQPSYYKVVQNHQDYVTNACPKLMTAFKQGRIVCSHEMKQIP